MADVFISYRNTPERRALVRRLASILRAHELTVWWDYGLEAGESYRAQITAELARAGVVVPLWCAESIHSPWVRMEAELGKDKLVPARLQKVAPPDAFEAIQAADLIGWDGAIGHPRLQAFVRKLCERLGRPPVAPTDMIEELAHLPAVVALPEVAVVAASLAVPAAPAHDYAFWERQWDKQGTGVNLLALRAIADDAPRYFAEQAKARIGEIEAEEKRQAAERERAAAAAEQRRVEELQQRYEADWARAQLASTVAAYEAFLGAWDGGAHNATAKQWLEAERAFAEARSKTYLVTVGSKAVELTPGMSIRDADFAPELVLVPPGRFRMGSRSNDWDADERPQHEVTINYPLLVGKFPVTFDQWEAFDRAVGIVEPHKYTGGMFSYPKTEIMGGKHTPSDHGWGRGLRPVIYVSWHYAKAYCQWLSDTTGKVYRLLSEAEWEYACRAGTQTAYSFGETITKQQAQYSDVDWSSAKQTVAVGSFPANPFGLHDMHGNVCEWVEDAWWDYSGATADGSVKTSGGDTSRRVLRGGSWADKPYNLRSACRNSDSIDSRGNSYGFRLARAL